MARSVKGRVYDVVLHPVLRYVVAPILAAGPAISRVLVDVPWVQVPVATIGLILTSVANYGAYQEEGRKERRADARNTLRTLLSHSVNCADVPAEAVRANIMLWDDRRRGLRMAYMTDGYSREEKSLVWRAEEGCVGRAYSQSATVIYPEDEEGVMATLADANAATRPWGMRRSQILATANRVGSVICTPVPSPHGTGEVIAMLSMDSGQRLDEGSLRQRGAVLESLRGVMGRVLDRAGLRFPEDDADVLAAGHPRPEDDQ